MSDNLSGSSILSLPTVSTVDNADLFVVSQRDRYLHNEYDTKSVVLSNLQQYLVHRIVENMDLGSMAYEMSDDYSVVGHNHDNLYNKLDVTIPFEYPPGISSSDDVNAIANPYYVFDGYPIDKAAIEDSWLSIGNIFIDGRLSTLYLPLTSIANYTIIPWQLKEPRVGSIKFMAVNKLDAIDYTSDSFDGWLYPDGKTSYPLTAFMLSSYITSIPNVKTSGSGNAKTFVLPALSSFMKLSSTADSGGMFNYVTYKNGCIDHVHEVGMVVDGTVQTYGEISVTQSEGNGGGLHDGNGNTHTDMLTQKMLKKTTSKLDPSEKLGTFLSVGRSGRISSIMLNPKYDSSVKANPYSNIPDLSSYVWGTELGNITFSNEMNISCRCKLNLDNAGNIIGSSGSKYDIETYPSHNLLPVLMYVGKNNRTI